MRVASSRRRPCISTSMSSKMHRSAGAPPTRGVRNPVKPCCSVPQSNHCGLDLRQRRTRLHSSTSPAPPFGAWKTPARWSRTTWYISDSRSETRATSSTGQVRREFAQEMAQPCALRWRAWPHASAPSGSGPRRLRRPRRAPKGRARRGTRRRRPGRPFVASNTTAPNRTHALRSGATSL